MVGKGVGQAGEVRRAAEGDAKPKGGVDVGDHPPITPVRAASEGEIGGEGWGDGGEVGWGRQGRWGGQLRGIDREGGVDVGDNPPSTPARAVSEWEIGGEVGSRVQRREERERAWRGEVDVRDHSPVDPGQGAFYHTSTHLGPFIRVPNTVSLCCWLMHAGGDAWRVYDYICRHFLGSIR